MTLSLVSIPVRERKWMDINPATFNEGCFVVSKFMIRLLRHEETIPTEDDGAVRFDDLIENFKVRFDGTSQWTIWIAYFAKGRGPKKRFQYCLKPDSSKHFLYFRAIQGHSRGTLVDPTLRNNVLLPDDVAECIYHIGNADEMHSVIKSGPIAGGSLRNSQCSSQP